VKEGRWEEMETEFEEANLKRTQEKWDLLIVMSWSDDERG